MSGARLAPVDADFAAQLIAEQFPTYAKLPVTPVSSQGWDNYSFRLGDQYLVRMPAAACYAAQVAKEQTWLPRLAPHLSCRIPTPVAMGRPAQGYPFHWSIYDWIEGATLNETPEVDQTALADDLANFLTQFWSMDASEGPSAGPENFFRGGALEVYAAEAREAIKSLDGAFDRAALMHALDIALSSTWPRSPVWVHGDLTVGNLIIQGGRLTGVIDFGQLCVGDPACDLAIAWTYFDADARASFLGKLAVDEPTRSRARGWALWKAVIVEGGRVQTNEVEKKAAARTINQVLTDLSST